MFEVKPIFLAFPFAVLSSRFAVRCAGTRFAGPGRPIDLLRAGAQVQRFAVVLNPSGEELQTWAFHAQSFRLFALEALCFSRQRQQQRCFFWPTPKTFCPPEGPGMGCAMSDPALFTLLVMCVFPCVWVLFMHYLGTRTTCW